MNGLSRQNKKSKNFIIKLGLVYVLSYIILGLFILLYPKYSNMKLDNNIKEYKSTINKALANSVDLTSLKKLTNTYPSQLVVKSEDELIYTNMEISESYVLSKIVDDSVVSYQEQYQEQAYDIYYLLYKEDNKIILNNLTTIYIIFTGVSMLCVILIIKKSLSSIHYSLDNAFNNIQKIKKNKLINNGSFEERINLFSEELKEFVGDIDKKVTEYQIVYTKLEKELLLKNETSEEKKKMVSLLVHDLKTPISIINLSVLGLRNQLNQELKQLNHIEEGSDEILADVKSILKVVNENDLVSTKTKVDLVKEVKDLFKTYQKMFKAKKTNLLI